MMESLETSRGKEHIWIKELVGLKNTLDDNDKADILLAWSGFKTGAMINLEYPIGAGVAQHKLYQSRIARLREIINNLNLNYRLRIGQPKHKKEITPYSYIARKKVVVEKLISADNEKDIKKRRLRLGLLLGYPRTAVEAFASGNIIDFKNLPSSVRRQKEIPFLCFRLSKKNWREELKYAKNRAKEIRRISLDLYKKIVRKRRRAV